MNRIIISILLLLLGLCARGQTVVSSSGTSHSNSTFSTSWTVGELCTYTLSANNIILNQGFHQGNQINITISASNDSICSGSPISIFTNTNGNSSNFTYSWSSNPAGLSANTSSIQVFPQLSTWYYVTVNDGGISPPKTDSVYIFVHTSNFNLSFTASQTSFTAPPYSFNIQNQTPTSGNYIWEWNMGDGNTFSSVAPTHTYQYAGQYSISAKATSLISGCSDTLTKVNYIQCFGGNPCSLSVSISPQGQALICPHDSIKLTATYNTNASYKWILNGSVIANATDSVLYAKQNGLYQVMIYDTVCQVFSSYFNLIHNPVFNPIIDSNGIINSCSNDSAELFLNTTFSSYLWSNGATTSSIWVKNSGVYTVTITDLNNCKQYSSPFILNASLLPIPEICIVGVDSATNKNRIIWQRETNPMIDSFRIYRETSVANQYQLIGSKGFNDQSLFIDQNSIPIQQAYRYKITAVDTCGTETPMSNYHKTNHLTINAGLNGSWNLIWDGYQGFSFGSYRIYRGVDSLNLQFLTQIQSTLTSYTDLNPPSGNLYYQIEVVSPHACYPDSIISKAQTNYNTSRSNRMSTAAAPNIGIGEQNNEFKIHLYPNPNDGSFTLELNSSRNQTARLFIYNSLGQLLMEEPLEINGSLLKQLQLNDKPKGIYNVHVSTEKGFVYREKVIIQ